MQAARSAGRLFNASKQLLPACVALTDSWGCCAPALLHSIAKDSLHSTATAATVPSPPSWQHAVWRRSSTSSDLPQQLAEAGTNKDYKALLTLIEERGDSFDEACVAAAWRELAAAVAGAEDSTLQNVQENKSFATLVDMAWRSSGRFDAAQLVTIIDAAATLQVSDQKMLDFVASYIMEKIDAFGPQDLAKAAIAFARMDHSPSVILYDAVRARVKPVLSQLSNEEQQQLQSAYKQHGYEL